VVELDVTTKPWVQNVRVQPLGSMANARTVLLSPGWFRVGCMPEISRDEVARVAALARIDLTDAEVAKITNELNVIVDSVAHVSEIVNASVPKTSHPVPLNNVFREDVPEPSVNLAAVLAMAPEAEADMFVVPQILGEE